MGNSRKPGYSSHHKIDGWCPGCPYLRTVTTQSYDLSWLFANIKADPIYHITIRRIRNRKTIMCHTRGNDRTKKRQIPIYVSCILCIYLHTNIHIYIHFKNKWHTYIRVCHSYNIIQHAIYCWSIIGQVHKTPWLSHVHLPICVMRHNEPSYQVVYHTPYHMIYLGYRYLQPYASIPDYAFYWYTIYHSQLLPENRNPPCNALHLQRNGSFGKHQNLTCAQLLKLPFPLILVLHNRS